METTADQPATEGEAADAPATARKPKDPNAKKLAKVLAKIDVKEGRATEMKITAEHRKAAKRLIAGLRARGVELVETGKDAEATDGTTEAS